MDFKQNLINSIDASEQRVFVKFGVLQNHSAGLIHANLRKLLGSHAMSKSTIERYASRIRSGNFSIQSRAGGDQSDQAIRAERVSFIQECFLESRHWSLRSLASRTGIPYTTVQSIVTEELKMNKILGKWVPHELTPDQQNHRILACEKNLAIYRKTKALLKRTLSEVTIPNLSQK